MLVARDRTMDIDTSIFLMDLDSSGEGRYCIAKYAIIQLKL